MKVTFGVWKLGFMLNLFPCCGPLFLAHQAQKKEMQILESGWIWDWANLTEVIFR